MGLLRSSWRFPTVLAGVVVTLLVAVTPRLVKAQTLAISSTGITRQVALRVDPTSRFKVSRTDCLVDDVIGFPLVVGNYAGSSLEVWATQSTSDNCTEDTARTTATATCWRVYQATPNSTTITVPIRVQDFAARPGSSDGQGAGTEASCESTTSTGQPITLWFMFLQGTSQVGTAQSWSTTVDLLGPAPPAVEGIGLGSSLLKLSWAANTDPDVVSYRIFCEDLGDTAIHINTYEAGVPARDAASTATCPDASGTSDDAGTGDDDAGDPSDEAGTPTTDAGCTTSTPGTSADAGGGTSACESTLMKGEMLSPDQIKKYDCGTATGQRATSSIVKNLTNGNKYAIAVASSDLVENIGALSDVQCQTPELVNGFDELYRRAGGSAGGASFCSVGLRSAAARSSLWPGAAFLAVVALGRRRRRRPSV